jgi:hypothetical protein
MAKFNTALGVAALCAALALSAGCSFFDDEQPIPFEISRVVLPKDIPPPSDEKNSYPDGSGKTGKAPGTASSLAARVAAAEAQERMHARSALVAGTPDPGELVKVKVDGSDEGAFLTSKSFVTRWNILGPVPALRGSLPNDSSSDPLQYEYLPNEKLIDGSWNAPEGASWNVKVFDSATPPGLVDVGGVFNSQGLQSVYYATACLDSPEELEGVTLLSASTAPLKIWLNGVLVHTYDKGPRPLKLDQDAIEGVYLRKGYNRLVVKMVGVRGAPERKFMLRFASAAGSPIATEP